MKPALRSSQASPSSSRKTASVSFMPRSQRNRVDTDSSDEEAVDEAPDNRGDDSDDDDEILPIPSLAPPPTSSQSVSSRLKRAVISDDEDDEDDLPVVPSSSRRRRAEVIELDSNSESDVSPAKKRKTVHGSILSSSPEMNRPSTQTPARRLMRKGQPSSSPTKRHRGHRTEKQKNMELLRRRRAGEKIGQLTSSESESGDDKKGLYDTDSDDALQVLEEFPDDEDDEEEQDGALQEDDVEVDEDEPTSARKSKSAKNFVKQERIERGGDSNSEDDGLDDFVVEDDDGPIGAPANLDIPIEFTAQARLPLKEQFPFVVEWLIHNKINPAFDRKDDTYTHAWRKLDDEVRGLASSKFVSSVWKVEFYRTLKARPKLEAFDVGKIDSDLYGTCEACGRSGHPATWKIMMQGRPYHKDTLDEVESDSEDSDESDASGRVSIDTQGNSLPPQTREWSVGSTCSSNAETAHSLMHWKYALKEWVEDRLEMDGHMKAAKLKEREKMKPKKRRQAANDIVDKWQEAGVVASLFNDFKSVLQGARDKSTSGRGRRWK
ncbi:hypothetical protein BKA67DRAFT_663620 [Truncatella angustata]|uniref:DUF4211 domain-containing protein n=1 Tax=Truncatella angustata TaxID=152316 RepID=A0A9P8UCX7_9PEZI|nr:uncharacterized protein BKA67DRAFT_663620 [Truncatella angustata]KAH6647286.1 hypothetical protein BKA67DRAFT_663620 [Truncatella angustata]